MTRRSRLHLVDAVAPPVERVTHIRWPSPPTDYTKGVKDRWDAIAALYHGKRNRERQEESSIARSSAFRAVGA